VHGATPIGRLCRMFQRHRSCIICNPHLSNSSGLLPQLPQRSPVLSGAHGAAELFGLRLYILSVGATQNFFPKSCLTNPWAPYGNHYSTAASSNYFSTSSYQSFVVSTYANPNDAVISVDRYHNKGRDYPDAPVQATPQPIIISDAYLLGMHSSSSGWTAGS
jgi:hypothetical protein